MYALSESATSQIFNPLCIVTMSVVCVNEQYLLVYWW